MGKTTIEWTDFSINPIRARNKTTGAVGHYCEKISKGCQNCYSSNFQKRFRMPAFNEQRGDDNIEVFLDESKLREVIKRKKPTKFFWCDMTDMFGSWVPDGFIDKCFAAMALSPQHTHQILTKRPERMLQYLIRADRHNELELSADKILPGKGHPSFGGKHLLPKLPLPNVWLGVSCEDQKTALERVPHLFRLPAAIRFISAEPLLGSIDLGFATAYIDWVIVGGESGHGARPMHPQWARDLRDQCTAAGVAFHFKQWGEWSREPQLHVDYGMVNLTGKLTNWQSGNYQDSQKEEGALMVFRNGKHAAGRLLDGRTHDGFPQVQV